MSRKLTFATWLVFGLFFLSVVDSCSGLPGSDEVVRLLNGTAIPMSGSLDLSVSELEDLASSPPRPEDLDGFLEAATDAPGVSMHFQELTGRQWRGILETAPDSSPGEYSLMVYKAGTEPDPSASGIQLRVFTDEALYRADFDSWCERTLGLKPWWITLAMLPLGMFLLGASYVESDRRFQALAAQGVGTIYKLARQKDTWEVVFGLGSEHGVEPGQKLVLLNRRLVPVGSVIARQVEQDYSYALVRNGTDIGPGHYVAMPALGQDLTDETGSLPSFPDQDSPHR